MKAAPQRTTTINKQIDQLLDRIMRASMLAVIAKYKERIEALEKEKLLLSDTSGTNVLPSDRFNDVLNTP